MDVIFGYVPDEVQAMTSLDPELTAAEATAALEAEMAQIRGRMNTPNAGGTPLPDPSVVALTIPLVPCWFPTEPTARLAGPVSRSGRRVSRSKRARNSAGSAVAAAIASSRSGLRAWTSSGG